MKAIQIISQDLFDKVRSRFQNLEMGDETGAVTIDPSEARFFDFDFVNEGVNLGRVSISLNDVGSLKIYYSQGITENQDDPAKQLWYNFLKEMRLFSMRRLLRFDTRDIAKTNLDKNDFQHLATTQAPKEEEPTMNMTESRWNQKSSKKTSRAVKGATEVIVRHHSPVDEMYPGARSQKKNIKAIYIQNRDGERFKYPFIHPAGAFAMAQHVDHGGVPHDPAGKAIVRMSEQIAQLQEFSRQVQHTQLHDDAMGIKERAVGRLQELKAQIESLSKRHHYEAWSESFTEQDEPLMADLDAVTMETYKQQFTETNFKEDLAAFFPLIHSIMKETNTIDLEEYVSEETDICPDCKEDPCVCDSTVKEDAFNEFAEWAEAVEQGKLTDDELEALKQAMNELPNGELELGTDGQTAWQFFSGLGLTDSDLEDKFKAASELDPSADPMEILKMWAQESYPELLVALGLSGTGETEPAPEAPPMDPMAAPAPAVPPAPEQPVAEGSGRMINGKEIDMRSLEIDGVDPRDYPDFSDAYISHASFTDGTDLSDEEMDQLNDEHGDLVHELAYDSLHENDEQGSMPTRESVIKEVAKIVKSFYNRDNPEVGPFRGGEGIAIDVKKQISEKFGEEAGEQAAQMAEQFMEKLTTEWQQRHSAKVDGDDGLARLKELVSNIKAKVESAGEKNPQHSHQYDTTMKHADNPTVQQRMAAHDIKPGIAGYRDRIDMLQDLERTGKLKNAQEEGGPDKSQVPAYKRKEQGGDWKMSTKDLEKEKTNSPTSSAGLARKKAELGMSEELASIMKLSGLAK